MVLAERLAAGYGDDDLFVIGWRAELGPHTCAVDMPGAPGHEVPPIVSGRVGGEDVYACWPLHLQLPGT